MSDTVKKQIQALIAITFIQTWFGRDRQTNPANESQSPHENVSCFRTRAQ
jgi:hypothetical protein